MRKFFKYAYHWARFRLFYWLKFLRPNNLTIAGRLKIDMRSAVYFDRGSTIYFGEGTVIKKSSLKIVGSTFKIGAASRIEHTVVLASFTNIKLGAHASLVDGHFGIKGGSILAGDHFMVIKEGEPRPRILSNHAKLIFGINVNIRAEISCKNSVLEIGDHVFINQGTKLRCHNHIRLGSNILVSYECLIFDTNTHAVDAKERRKELQLGYPNQVIQSEEIWEKVKTAPILIGNDVWIGTRAIIFKGSQLGNEVIVGAGAVLSGLHVGDKMKVFGNPAKTSA